VGDGVTGAFEGLDVGDIDVGLCVGERVMRIVGDKLGRFDVGHRVGCVSDVSWLAI
jgi:hypothetical protein